MTASRSRKLEARLIVEAARALRRRVEERFPGRGLAEVAGDLLAIAEDSSGRADWLARPVLGLRAATWATAAGLVAAVLWGLTHVQADPEVGKLSVVFQAVESAVNDAVFVGIAVWSLAAVEGRLKRGRALAALAELRALAHVVDMHQLTKDPERARSGWKGTASSPRQELSRFELSRYYDYCSELLSLDGKIAALFAQACPDPVVLSAVDEIESLASGLSQKIWQKTIVLQALPD